ncbi:MAG: quinol:cytochrome C oxidoreductase, partial [Acidobacteriota bacterium]
MEHDTNLPSEEIQLPDSWARFSLIAGAVGLVAMIAAIGLGQGSKDFSFSYLTAYFYWLTIALGGLFFVLLHYLARSGWSVVVRRLAEHVMGTLPLFALLFIPIALGTHDLYHWTHPEEVAKDDLLQHKLPYLNLPFFYARSAFYLVVWTALSVYFWRQSASQDESGDPEITRRLHSRSALGMVLFAVTATFASFDWVMTLEPHWFSTIFGVYVFAGCVVSILSVVILVVLRLKSAGALTSVVTWEHFHDLG